MQTLLQLRQLVIALQDSWRNNGFDHEAADGGVPYCMQKLPGTFYQAVLNLARADTKIGITEEALQAIGDWRKAIAELGKHGTLSMLDSNLIFKEQNARTRMLQLLRK